MTNRYTVPMPHVLVIESDKDDAASICSSLDTWGVSSMVVTDGANALAQLSSGNYQAVILSVELVRGSGYSICNKLKKDPQFSRIPLVLISGQATREIFEQHRRLKTHADAYLHKPLGGDILQQTLTPLLHMNDAAAASSEPDLLHQVSLKLSDSREPSAFEVQSAPGHLSASTGPEASEKAVVKQEHHDLEDFEPTKLVSTSTLGLRPPEASQGTPPLEVAAADPPGGQSTPLVAASRRAQRHSEASFGVEHSGGASSAAWADLDAKILAQDQSAAHLQDAHAQYRTQAAGLSKKVDQHVQALDLLTGRVEALRAEAAEFSRQHAENQRRCDEVRRHLESAVAEFDTSIAAKQRARQALAAALALLESTRPE